MKIGSNGYHKNVIPAQHWLEQYLDGELMNEQLLEFRGLWDKVVK
jgi:hypothetical protein